MELYIFSQDTRQLAGVIETYEYLRWTRRYSHSGSFDLIAIAAGNTELLQEGNIIRKSDDDEAGIIERVELSQTDREIISVSGRFATGLLSRRIIWGTETLSGDLGAVVGQLLNRHLLTPADPDRAIAGILYIPVNLSVPVQTQISFKNLMEAVCDLCDGLSIGVKTLFNPATGLFTVALYDGGMSSAVFGAEYENLTEQTYVRSVEEYANTVLVGGEGEGAARQFVTIAQGSGESRREMFVDARDLQSADFPGSYTDALLFRGQTRLSELVPRYSFDAGVNPHGNLSYKTDFDLGNVVKVFSKSWGVSMTARITEIEETYDADGLSLMLTFGKAELTLAQKMRSDMSDIQTSLLAPSGGSGEIPDGSVTSLKLADSAVTSAKIASGAVETAGIVDGAVTMAKINASALPTTENLYGRRLVTDTNQSGEAANLNTFLTAGEYTLYNVTSGLNFPPGTWTGIANIPHLVVQRYYSDTIVRQILTKRGSPNDIWTRTSSSATSWTAWFRIPALNDNGEIVTANIAAGAVTMAKIASAQDASFTYNLPSGVTVNVSNCVCFNTVVHLYIRISVTSAIGSGGTVLTITNSNFQPPTTLNFSAISMSATVAGFRVIINTSGVIMNGNSGATGIGYFDITATFSRKN